MQLRFYGRELMLELIYSAEDEDVITAFAHNDGHKKYSRLALFRILAKHRDWVEGDSLNFQVFSKDNLFYELLELLKGDGFQSVEELWVDTRTSSRTRKRLSSLQYLTNLRSLGFGGRLPVLPSELTNISSLEKLNIAQLGLEQLPEMSGLTSLRSLYLGGNEFSVFPRELKDLPDLECLNLSSSKFETIPDYQIDTMPKLREINFYNTPLQFLPYSFALLQNLKVLSLKKTAIESLVPNFGELQNLEVLNLSYTKLKELPACVYRLKNLKRLDISHTGIKDIFLLLVDNLPSLNHLTVSKKDWDPQKLSALQKLRPYLQIQTVHI